MFIVLTSIKQEAHYYDAIKELIEEIFSRNKTD